MAFECNIDARGKAARMKLGMRVVFLGVLLTIISFFGFIPTPVGWLVSGGTISGGLFAMWEARMGWCIIRAMGFKTRV